MAINLSDGLHAATTKGKLADAKEIYLEGDTKNLQQSNDEQDSHLSQHDSEISEAKSRLDGHDTFNQNQTQKNTELDANMKKLNDRDDQITELVKGVTATGGASVATAVSYDNTASKLTAATAQGAIDEIQSKKFDKTDVVQSTGTSEDKVMSQKVVTEGLNETSSKLVGVEVLSADMTKISNVAVFAGLKNGDKLSFSAELKDMDFNSAYVGLYDTAKNQIVSIYRSYETKKISKYFSDEFVIENDKVGNGFTLCLNIYNTNTSERKISNASYTIGKDNSTIALVLKRYFDKDNVVQSTGTSEDKVMSQKVVTEGLNETKTTSEEMINFAISEEIKYASYISNIGGICLFDDVKDGDFFKFKAYFTEQNNSDIYLGLYNVSSGVIESVYKSYKTDLNYLEDEMVISNNKVGNGYKLIINAYTKPSERKVKSAMYISRKNIEVEEIDKKIYSLYTPISFLKNKFVDANLFNRLLISIYGDSIMGAQLDALDDVDGYSTGNFPPNMHKKTHAYQLWSKYKFDGEDTVFYNLKNGKWNKTGFSDTWIDHFNKFEAYPASSDGATATITITGYKFFKLVWYQAWASQGNTAITISIDGGEFKKPSENGIDLPDGLPIVDFKNKVNSYAICSLDANKTYTFKIVVTKKNNAIALWGCEVWNNPRLDVVNEAISGITAQNSMLYGGEKLYYNDYHKPLLAILEILYINDSSYIKTNSTNHNLTNWQRYNTEIIDILKKYGIPIFGILPHGAGVMLESYAKGIAEMNNIYYLNMMEKIKKDGVNVVGSDGIHLSQTGNDYYAKKIAEILDTNLN